MLVAALATAAAALLSCSSAHAAAVGALVQLPAPNDCLEQDSSFLSIGGEGCGATSGRGLLGASVIAVAPDGRDAYVAAGENISGRSRAAASSSCNANRPAARSRSSAASRRPARNAT